MKDSLIPYSIVKSLSVIENIYEMRLFGLIFAKAQSVLKLYDRNLGQINLQHALNLVRVTLPARYVLAEGDNNYRNINKAFTLANKTLDYERDGTTYKLNIIAFPELVKRGKELTLTFVIHNELWHALLNFSQGYRIVNLPSFLSLKTKYSVIVYILISQQSRNLTLALDSLRKILGAQSKAYDRTSNFITRVIEPARRDIAAHCPTSFEYALNREGSGRGGRFTTLTFIPIQNNKFVNFQTARKSSDLEKLRVRLSDEVRDYLDFSFQMSVQEIEQSESLILSLGNTEQQIDFLCKVKEYCDRKRVENKSAYLYKSLTSNL